MSDYEENAEAQPEPDRGPRKGEGKMEADEFQALVGSLIKEAQGFTMTLEQTRTLATDYFHGRPFGNEKEGRSSVVLTEVRDKVLGVMPDFMALFFGQDRQVEYIPTSAEKVDAVEQITDYVTKAVIEIDNNGFMLYYSVLMDGLVRKLGGVKWGWEEGPVKQYSQTGLTREEVELITADDEVEIVELEPSKLSTPGNKLFDIEYKRGDPEGRARAWPLPPEELIFIPSTRDPQTTLYIGHQLDKTRGELRELGVSEKDIEDYGGKDSLLERSPLRIARLPRSSQTDDDTTEGGEANNKILYIEGYARIDYDGDGIAELRKICTIGPSFHIVMNEPVDEVPMAAFCPVPEPHTLVGQSYADLTMDIQRIKSAVARGILDSLSTAIFPRTWYKENDANVTDVMSTAIGAPIRTRSGANAVGTFQHTFVGKDAFPLLTYFDDVSERRTGNVGAQGIDMDALQSTTKSGVESAVTANRKHTELVARIFAETTLKPMYRGLYKLIKRHQPRKRMVRLRERWVEVDPRTWDDDLDVQVNVALGSAPREQKLQALAFIQKTQEGLLQTLGMDNPIVGLGNYRYTLGKIAELSGFPDSTRFFKSLPLNWQPPQPPPGSQPPPDPNMAMVQVEAQKVQMQMQLKQQELQMKMQEMMLEHQQRMQEIAARHANDNMKAQIDLALRERQLAINEFAVSAKAGMDARKANAEVDLMQAEADIMAHKAGHETTLAHAQHQLDVAETAHSMHIEGRKQDLAEQQAAQQAAAQPAGGAE